MKLHHVLTGATALAFALGACKAKDSHQSALTVTASMRDDGQPTEAVVFELQSEPGATMACLDCETIALGRADASGHMKVEFKTQFAGPPKGHCFRAWMAGTTGDPPAGVCAEPKLSPGMVQHGNDVSCTRVKCEFLFSPDGVTVGDFEPGATLDVGGVKIPTGAHQHVAADDARYFAGLTLDAIKANTKLADVPFSATFTDGQKLSGTFTVTADDLGRDALEKATRIETGPVKFPGETSEPAPAKPRGIEYVADTHGGYEIFGSPRLLTDVDQIAYGKRTFRELERCKYVGDKTGADAGTLVRGANDVVVTVYDRRSGKVVVKRTFAAPTPAPCPRIYSSATSFVHDADEAAIVAWIKSRT